MNIVADDNTNQERRVQRIMNVIRGREQYLLALLLFVTACTAGVVLHHLDKYSFYYFGDAASHIIKAREFTDSRPHEIPIVGTVWLPLPHLLLLPFASVDAFFFSGIAGAFVGIPCLVGTGILIFLLLRNITGSASIAFLMASLYGLNPNVVYMSLTPMDEPSLIFLVSFAGYALYRWRTNDSPVWFLICAGAVMLATLCRYEAWPLAALVAFAGTSKARLRWRELRRRESIRIIAISALSLAGIVLWSLWHVIVFGNPFEFAHGTYSVLSSVYRESSQHLPSSILVTFCRAILIIFGPVLLLVAATAFIPLTHMRVDRTTILLLVFFILPLLFIITAALAGYVGIDEWWWNWRYILSFGLFLAVAGGAGLMKIFSKIRTAWGRSIVVTILLAMPVVQLVNPSIGIAVYKDAAKCIDGTVRDAIAIGEQLPVVYSGGSIGLITNGNYTVRIQISSSLPLKQFRVLHFSADQKIPDSTWLPERYLIVQKNETPESELLAPSSAGKPGLLMDNFQLRFENASFALLERKPAAGDSSIPP
jgi:hypothetical protein